MRSAGSQKRPVSRTPKPQRQAKSPRVASEKISILRPNHNLGRIVASSTIVSISLLVILVFVAAFTPLLAVEKIDVVGNQRIPTKLLANALSNQLGKPLPQISLDSVSNDLKNFTLVQSVSVVNVPPHTLQVRIVERQAICIIRTNLGLFVYDPAGVRIASVNSTNNYPVVEAAGAPGKSAEFKAAIQTLLALPLSVYPRVASVSAPSMDSVTFHLRGMAAQKVIWGDSTQAVLKAKVLLALIKHQRLSDRVTYDVSSPKDPTVRY
jgi:cell division protein FtsQ